MSAVDACCRSSVMMQCTVLPSTAVKGSSGCSSLSSTKTFSTQQDETGTVLRGAASHLPMQTRRTNFVSGMDRMRLTSASMELHGCEGSSCRSRSGVPSSKNCSLNVEAEEGEGGSMAESSDSSNAQAQV